MLIDLVKKALAERNYMFLEANQEYWRRVRIQKTEKPSIPFVK